MIISELLRGMQIPQADYIFDNKKDFLKLVPYLRERIEGEWSVIVIGLKYKEIEDIISLHLPDYTNVTVFTSKEIKEKLSLKYPQFISKTKTKHEMYIDILKSYDNLTFTKAAMNEIYSRCSANLEEIKEAIPKIVKAIPEDKKIMVGNLVGIDVTEVDRVLEKQEVAFASDVINAYLLKDKLYKIPKKGSRLSKFKYKKAVAYRDILISTLGKRQAFYACRKYIKELLDEKIKFMDGEDCKNIDILTVVSYFEILHAWLTFKVSNPNQFEICLWEIERRQKDDSSFRETFLGINT